MRFNIKKAIQAIRYNKRKKKYLKQRQKLLASYSNSDMSPASIAEYEKRKAALHEEIMNERK